MVRFLRAVLLVFTVSMSTIILSACSSNVAQSSSEKMTAKNLQSLIQKFDDKAVASGNGVSFTLNERELFLVYDEKADRMRVITPIAQSGIASDEILIRMMQANYDAVLDARYAMANDIIWSVFIHPLSSLTQKEFLSGIAQTVTAAETFGTSYTSGAFVFGGGDSNSIHEDLLKELEKATAVGKEI